MNDEHKSVLLKEAIDALNIKEDGIYVDLTLGRAGHSEEVLKRLSSKGLLIGVDMDEEAIEKSEERLKKVGSNFILVHSSNSAIDEILHKLKITQVDGVIADLGVSSPQFDYTERGFSYRGDGPLDMRMDSSNPLTAYEVVNTYSEQELERIFRELGDEKYAKSIAKRIVKERNFHPIDSTLMLVDIIKMSMPSKELNKKGHPAKKVFQAIRMEVNDEMGALRKILDVVPSYLASGGRFVIISFEKTSDKLIKDRFKELSVKEGNRYNDYEDPSYKDMPYIQITKKPIVPSVDEIEENRRARTAKMRVLERR